MSLHYLVKLCVAFCNWTSPSYARHPSYDDCLEVRGNIIRTPLCWIMWQCSQSVAHLYDSSSYRSNRLGLSHWDPYTVHRDSCLSSCIQCWVSYFLKVTCYCYKLLHEESNLLQLLVTFFSKVTCYIYCYILKVTSYFTSYFIDTLLHDLHNKLQGL